jgi:hypothetical protein
VLTTKRTLIHALLALYPPLTLHERDFSTLTPTPAYLSSSSSRTTGMDDDGALAEADILLSPTTGLVLTTLQRIAQLPLPGAPPHTRRAGKPRPPAPALPPFHARLRALSARYPRLIVLVSQGVAPTPGILSAPRHANGDAPGGGGGDGEEEEGEEEEEDAPLPASATRALARLHRAAARCAPACAVAVQFVPGGGAALARWAAWHVLRSGSYPSSPAAPAAGGGAEDERAMDKGSLGDETAAETILRRAGLNAFAAAVVLERLRSTSSLSSSLSSPTGTDAPRWPTPLAAFVAMDPRERAARFARLLGGPAVVERVGRVLERRWISAGEGFARP